MFIRKILKNSGIMGDVQEASSHYGLRELHINISRILFKQLFDLW